MKAIHWITAAAALACTEPVQAAVSDPEVIIYRFPGVKDDGGAAAVGVATAFICTNFSGVTESIRLVTRQANGVLLTNVPFNIAHLDTHTFTTHVTSPFSQFILNTGIVIQGTTAIAATSINIICTANGHRCGESETHGRSVARHQVQPRSG